MNFLKFFFKWPKMKFYQNFHKNLRYFCNVLRPMKSNSKKNIFWKSSRILWRGRKAYGADLVTPLLIPLIWLGIWLILLCFSFHVFSPLIATPWLSNMILVIRSPAFKFNDQERNFIFTFFFWYVSKY